MKKKRTLIITASLGILTVGMAAVLAMSAFPVSASPTPAAERHGGEPWSFKEGRGLTLSDAARLAADIVLASVEFAELIPEQNKVAAQIYRAAAESGDRTSAAASMWVPPSGVSALSTGQTIDLTNGRLVFSSQVVAIKPPIQAEAPSEVLLVVTDSEGQLRIGDFLQTRLVEDGSQRREATTIPASAVIESVRGNFVYAANGGAFLRTPVTLGSRQGDRIEVVDGLFEGDEIVTAGASNLWMIELQAVNGGKGCADGH
jgi:multidrug efflux pump subunit AcrA (membrane-fusion protein)